MGCSVLPSILRARIDGAVMRLPGTGEGVARLVEVSIVKVDMAAASSRAAVASLARLFADREPLLPTGAFGERNGIEHRGALVAKDRERAADRAGGLVVAIAA